MLCIPSIFIKNSQFFFGESWHQSSISKIVGNFFGDDHNCHRAHWKWPFDFRDFSPQKKFWWKMADVFLNSAIFWQHVFSTLAPPSSYTMNLKTLTKVPKVSWTSKVSYEILYDSFEWKFRKDKLHLSQKKLLQKARIV